MVRNAVPAGAEYDSVPPRNSTPALFLVMPAVPVTKPLPVPLIFIVAPLATSKTPLTAPKSSVPGPSSIVPSSRVTAVALTVVERGIVTVKEPVASEPAEKIALSLAVHVVVADKPVESVVQFAVAPVSQVPVGVGPPAPVLAPLMSQYLMAPCTGKATASGNRNTAPRKILFIILVGCPRYCGIDERTRRAGNRIGRRKRLTRRYSIRPQTEFSGLQAQASPNWKLESRKFKARIPIYST